jgi:hypothetical protein
MFHGTVSVHLTTVSQKMMLDDSNIKSKLTVVRVGFAISLRLRSGGVRCAVCLGSVGVPGGTEIDLMLEISVLY